ncbi:MAG: alanine racemase, partial [Flavisolibacter sp.]
NECLVVNDSYSNDITSLRIALDFMHQQSAGFKRTVILSEFFETDRTDRVLYEAVTDLLSLYKITRAIVIGEKIAEFILPKSDGQLSVQSYLSTDDFIRDFRASSFFREIILIKGARKFEFERIAQLFERKLHQTVLEVNLDALAHNLKHYQKLLHPGTKVMAMVKAFAYGSGGAEIAGVLQFHNTDYLGVAYADEGADLVKAGIRIPIMVMNTEESSFRAIIDYNLEPTLFSYDMLKKFEAYLKQQGLSHYPVHIEVETGMNRLGFALNEIGSLADLLSSGETFTIRSVFTHLAASEDASQDGFTNEQVRIFLEAINILSKEISYPFLKHIANSAAIVRHPQLQLDMVRLGIGLYGVDVAHKKLKGLKTVATLRSTIAQLKKVNNGDSVSYNRKGVVHRNSIIATVRIGYADGYFRQFGNGVGKMLVRGKMAPVIGTVCMDMTMIDVTDIPDVIEGDDVIIFGSELPVHEVASWANTISYELMTAISQRVKRIYYHE